MGRRPLQIGVLGRDPEAPPSASMVSVDPRLRLVVHPHLHPCLRPVPASLARVMGDWLTRDALRPRWDAGRGKAEWDETGRSSPRVFFTGNRTQGGVAVMGAAVTRLSRHGASRKAQLGQGE